MSAVRSEAEKDTFRGARLDALMYKLCPCHALFTYIADCEGPKFHTKKMTFRLVFFRWAGRSLRFLAYDLICIAHTFHSKFLYLLLFSDYELLCEGSQASHA